MSSKRQVEKRSTKKKNKQLVLQKSRQALTDKDDQGESVINEGGISMGSNIGYKITVNSGKVVMLRSPKIEDRDVVFKVLGGSVDEKNVLAAGPAYIKEMAKLLILSIDGKEPSASERESLTSAFDYLDWMQLEKVVTDLVMVGEKNAPKLEMVTMDQKAS